MDVNQCVFYKDSLFHVLPTNFLAMKYSDNEGETWSDMYLLGDFREYQPAYGALWPGHRYTDQEWSLCRSDADFRL